MRRLAAVLLLEGAAGLAAGVRVRAVRVGAAAARRRRLRPPLVPWP